MSRALCDIPVDVLEKQLVIDAIPQLMLVTILVASSILVTVWYARFAKDKELSLRGRSYLLLALSIVLMPLWYEASFVIKSVLTNITNPEYASILKFIEGCPSSVK